LVYIPFLFFPTKPLETKMSVTQQKLPTRQNVEKILKAFAAKEGLIYLNGQVVVERDDTDVELPFRQESNFFYVTGK
jgi:Xaa-Pro dipeptidase